MKTIEAALVRELDGRGYDGQAAVPWYFPTVEDYGARLAAAGFDTSYIALIPRPTPLPDMMGWLTTFSGCFTSLLPPEERTNYLACVVERLRSQLCDEGGNWTADYVRLRFSARLTPSRTDTPCSEEIQTLAAWVVSPFARLRAGWQSWSGLR